MNRLETLKWISEVASLPLPLPLPLSFCFPVGLLTARTLLLANCLALRRVEALLSFVRNNWTRAISVRRFFSRLALALWLYLILRIAASFSVSSQFFLFRYSVQYRSLLFFFHATDSFSLLSPLCAFSRVTFLSPTRTALFAQPLFAFIFSLINPICLSLSFSVPLPEIYLCSLSCDFHVLFFFFLDVSLLSIFHESSIAQPALFLTHCTHSIAFLAKTAYSPDLHYTRSEIRNSPDGRPPYKQVLVFIYIRVTLFILCRIAL